MLSFSLILICLFVGFLVGGTGMGGILIPPALILSGSLEAHLAMATTLTSFIPMNIFGIFLFARKGWLERSLVLPLVLGGAATAGPFALWNVNFHAQVLTILLAILVLFSGISVFRPVSAAKNAHKKPLWRHPVMLFATGAVTGVMAGLTGAGGPLLAISWLVYLGCLPHIAVALSMPYSLATALAATLCNCLNGTVHFTTLWQISLYEFTGYLLGYYFLVRLPVALLKKCMGVTCVGLGGFLLFRCLYWDF